MLRVKYKCIVEIQCVPPDYNVASEKEIENYKKRVNDMVDTAVEETLHMGFDVPPGDCFVKVERVSLDFVNEPSA